MRSSLVTLFVCFALLSYAGTARADSGEARETPLKPGAWAFQFRITDNFTLSSFDGTTIGVKRHFSEKSALRLGASINTGKSDTEDSRRLVDQDTLRLGYTNTDESDYFNIDLDLMYMRYMGAGEPVSFFWGTGPLFGYATSNTESISPTTGGDRTRESEQTTWNLGWRAACGGEWFVRKWLGLHAEYRVSLSYEHLEGENNLFLEEDPTYISSYKEHTHNWRLRGDSVTFGLSLYF